MQPTAGRHIETIIEAADSRFFDPETTPPNYPAEAFKLSELFWLKHQEILPTGPALLHQAGMSESGEFVDVEGKRDMTVTLIFDPSEWPKAQYGWYLSLTKSPGDLGMVLSGGWDTYGLIVNRSGKFQAAVKHYDVQGKGESAKIEDPTKVLRLITATLSFAQADIERKATVTNELREKSTHKRNQHIMKNEGRLNFAKRLLELEMGMKALAFSGAILDKFVSPPPASGQ